MRAILSGYPNINNASVVVSRDTLRLLGTFDIPFDLPVTGMGGARATPVAGGGVELYLGNDITASVIGELGVELIKPPGSDMFSRLGYSLKLGLGYRIF